MLTFLITYAPLSITLLITIADIDVCAESSSGQGAATQGQAPATHKRNADA